jgi:hypothetical protein
VFCTRTSVLGRYFTRLCVAVIFLMSLCTAQRTDQVSGEKDQRSASNSEKLESNRAKLGRLAIEWMIGPYIPVQGPLQPLSTGERGQIYLRQTFLTAGSYAKIFSAGLDQARGEPHQWGDGMAGYGRR